MTLGWYYAVYKNSFPAACPNIPSALSFTGTNSLCLLLSRSYLPKILPYNYKLLSISIWFYDGIIYSSIGESIIGFICYMPSFIWSRGAFILTAKQPVDMLRNSAVYSAVPNKTANHAVRNNKVIMEYQLLS